MTKLKCLRCNWTWTPRTDNPAMCPKCKSRFWDIPPKVEEKPEQEKQADA